MERFNSDRISAEEVAIMDNNARWLGIPVAHLMECAGYSCANEIISKYKLEKDSRVVIFCGTGNNGGDGFVLARHLAGFHVKSIVFLLGAPEKIRTAEAQLNWNIITKSLNYSIETRIIGDSTDLADQLMNTNLCKGVKVLIDCLLGTGVSGKIREPIATSIDLINSLKEQFKIPVVSVDIPSGMNPNTGEVFHKAVKADLVLALHRNKKGLSTESNYIGEIIVKSIGIPKEASLYVGLGDITPTLKIRKRENHKGQFGRMLVIGGSKNYSGAPAYSSLTGIHFGIDLVITYVPEIVGDVIRSYSPNMIVRTNPGNWLKESAFDEILELITWANVVLIGPGLGLEKKTEDLLIRVIEELNKQKKSYVLDADALKLIKNHLDLIKNQKAILTPHSGELKLMTGIDFPPNNQIEECSKKILDLAKKLGVVLIIKGPNDYISDGSKVKINRTGCAEMSIGGTGDVLAGLCASFMATENAAFQSACSAAFLNGYVGEYCKKEIGPRFTAMDMINNINNTLGKFYKI